ncbi:MAG: helix-turn-helix transcriptional regulator, partial [Planktomarina sp.]|jgi:transcriptional regulator with XRE-family HTH domain|nr:helix-turn-helix transcriptional regulator [Planktomarina sp.]MDA9238167.1 helix-turn-helix domain-containing protein [Planktomarina sp.]MDA9271528.1 helix-turn-helix domain-containing protein [Planktomarina sp.]MDB4115529.1 helix-turn-helix domain-containing protein [Planktomarina sp.]MDC1249357.1 helix-turn-helix domain-containing protein [Planktomarina sp.]|tara:strand:- start:567 stop:962 length:396 start_codon:yes stop_codon:yes gene_type:complete
MAEKVNNEDFDWFGPDAATFGDRVVGARENSNMTQGQLSRRLGIKLATLQAWEEDRSEPRANKLQMLSGMLNVSLPWLLSGQGIGPDEPIQEPVQNDISIILLEMRSIKTQMNQTADRLSRLEKQLRLAQK